MLFTITKKIGVDNVVYYHVVLICSNLCCKQGEEEEVW